METTHTVRDNEIASAKNALNVAQEELNAYIKELREKRHGEFVAKGGCAECNGYGRVLTWSTLDGPGWWHDEFGVCPNPTCTAHTVGIDITKCEPGSRGYSPSWSRYPQGQQEEDKLAHLEQGVQTAQDVLKSVEDKWLPSKGKEVEVIRSSKGAKKGDKGIVFWVGDSEFQAYRGAYVAHTLKVGFKTPDGVAHWTTSKSCVVTNPNVKEDAAALVCAKVKRESMKAYLMLIKGKEVWVPKSICKKLNDVGYMIPHWFLDQNGLEVR